MTPSRGGLVIHLFHPLLQPIPAKEQSMSDEPIQDLEAQKIRDMVLYQAVTGAQRVRLDDGWCGYQIGSERIPCFQGHEHFQDESKWAWNCPGPQYSSNT